MRHHHPAPNLHEQQAACHACMLDFTLRLIHSLLCTITVLRGSEAYIAPERKGHTPRSLVSNWSQSTSPYTNQCARFQFIGILSDLLEGRATAA